MTIQLTSKFDTRPACTGEPTTVFFPNPLPGRNQPTPAQYQAALNMCANCHAHDDCRRAWIDADRPTAGVWFGTTPAGRQRQGLGRGRLYERCDCGQELTIDQQRARRHYCGPECADAARKAQIARHDAARHLNG